MPSPFPGVDPYIENAGLWSGFHWRLITFLASALRPLIRPRYFAEIQERLMVLAPEPRPIFPDVAVLDRPPVNTQGSNGTPADGRASLMTDTGVIIEEQVEKVSQGFIQIIDLKLNRRLVTQIEVLSPTNKTGDGKKEYQEKQAEVRGSPVHLVELDLLKNGSHTVAIPLVLLRQRFGTYDYLVSINSPPERYRHKVYAFPLDARLPALHIPLAAPDPAVAIELQTVYDRAYDEAGYDDVIDYSRDPLDVRLSQSQLQWLDQLLREKGKR